MVQKMQNIKKVRGHLFAVYCATFDRSGRFVITGSDDKLVKIWSMESALCLASCRGHTGDITDLAVNFSNTVVASASNDKSIRVWRLNDGCPVSVLLGHTGDVTAIAFSPRQGSLFQLLSASVDGTCRLWDALHSTEKPRVYFPKPSESVTGRNSGPSSSTAEEGLHISCCAFNSSGTVFVTGSSDSLARVWNACKSTLDDSELPNHEMDILAGHENDVNYVQFSGCAVTPRFFASDVSKEENIPKFKNTWYNRDNIVTCSRDGSAIIWIPRSRRSHGKVGHWTRAYHLKVPPPPMPPQPPRGGPHQRILPTPRGVNMIVWSLDNHFVLAAIMDCRICVWNAGDGSLLHSLTGHTEQTYVLDVHPSNPRIAMSAGYDGRTIVWDIWEGKPVRTYEIGQFKLVDGKFSPDGTSIIVSDDAGQLYILSTGQGESQMDAKYEQFFLGDYRHIFQDTYGNVIDQETQLVPFRRNMQDLLCDSGLVPYPEPYQSMYQRQRHGILGNEWQPSTFDFAVGVLPDDNISDQIPIVATAALDFLPEPLPEPLDAVGWEPEIEIQSDDTDSEYHVTEENCSGGEKESLNSGSPGHPEISEDDSEYDSEDGLRRSKRKKQKAEIEVTTSSGRRVKRKHLDDYGNCSLSHNHSRKSKSGKKFLRKRSSLSKSSRPRRAAARNALHLFSRITGASTDVDEEHSTETDLSESDTILEDTNVASEESDLSLHNEQQEHFKGNEILIDHSVDVDRKLGHRSEFHLHDGAGRRLQGQPGAGAGRRLIVKFPNPDLYESVTRENAILECGSEPHLAGPSSRSHNDADEVYSQEQGSNEIDRSHIGPPKVQHCLDLLASSKDGNICWGGVRTRTSKRLRMRESPSLVANSNSFVDEHDKKVDFALGRIEAEPEVPSSLLVQNEEGTDHTVETNKHQGSASSFNDLESAGDVDANSFLIESQDCEKSSSQQVIDDSALSSPRATETNKNFHLEKSLTIPRHLFFKSSIVSSDHGSSGKIGTQSSFLEDSGHNFCGTYRSDVRKDTNHGVLNGSHTGTQNLDNGNHQMQESNALVDTSCRPGSLDLQQLPPQNRTFTAVYRRSKSLRGKSNQKHENGSIAVSNSTIGDPNQHDGNEELIEGVRRMRSIRLSSSVDNHNLHGGDETQIEGVRRTRSNRLRSNIHALEVAGGKNKYGEAFIGTPDTRPYAAKASNGEEDISYEENGSGQRPAAVGLRSSRNRRSSYFMREASPPDRKKSNHLTKGSWLMLSTHEEGSRYIPQKGDNVVYLSQGHEEYIIHNHLRESGPWDKFKGNIRAVEFCKVEELEYSTHPGSGDSCCKMLLRFVDPTSDVVGKSFRLTLPEVTSFPDFLVERSRYDSAVLRKWASRDKCQVWWKNEGEENGSWWDGRILAVKPKSSNFPESPWERYVVQYKSDPRETHQHSPWELFDSNTQWDQPHIDDGIRAQLLGAFSKLEKSVNTKRDHYGVQKLKDASQKASFINRFPVPLSLEVIHSRLENNYYRSLEAMKHDIQVMLSNAESYFGRNADGLAKMRRLSEWFTRLMSSV